MRQAVSGRGRTMAGDPGVSVCRSSMVPAGRVALPRTGEPASGRLADRHRLPLATGLTLAHWTMGYSAAKLSTISPSVTLGHPVNQIKSNQIVLLYRST